jgi:hypothetical protein
LINLTTSLFFTCRPYFSVWLRLFALLNQNLLVGAAVMHLRVDQHAEDKKREDDRGVYGD